MVPIFHILPDHEEPFAMEFRERFGEVYALLTLEQIEDLRLFGPEKLSPIMKKRLGTFMGIAPQSATFLIQPSNNDPPHMIGFHGGLSRQEMEIPLIVL